MAGLLVRYLEVKGHYHGLGTDRQEPNFHIQMNHSNSVNTPLLYHSLLTPRYTTNACKQQVQVTLYLHCLFFSFKGNL